VIGEGLKLDVYFGESLEVGGRPASEALMELLAECEVAVGALYRGIEGFGIGRRIHAERFPDISTDLPLIAEAIDARERIEALLQRVDAVVDKGLVTVEHSLLATGGDVARADFPDGVGASGRLIVYCARGERAGPRPAHRAVVDLLRRHGANGATVLLGVDGVIGGRRRRAALFTRNADVPMAVVAVGPIGVLRRVLGELPGVLREPLANLERIAVVKHDGTLLEPLPLIPDDLAEENPPAWLALRVYTRQSARAGGQAVSEALTRRLRVAGAAGVTTLRGEWGFSSDEHPFGERLGGLVGQAPTYTVLVDRPGRIAELWPIIDEVTATHGVVTAALVPAYRERAGTVGHGRLRVAGREELAALGRTQAAAAGPAPVSIATRWAGADAPEREWATRMLEQIDEFAHAHDRPRPLVRVTLADGEAFFLAALEPRPGHGFITLHPHPDAAGELVTTADGHVTVPRALVVALARIAKVELLASVPRGTRSDVGFVGGAPQPGERFNGAPRPTR
jgi:PII-like signaling protein